jgi:hypothetical protein
MWLRPSDVRTAEQAMQNGQHTVTISLDLGITQQELQVEAHHIVLGKSKLSLPKVKKEEKVCFYYEKEFKRLRFAGEQTGMIYELVETAGRPMLKVSATPFHKWDFIKRIELEKPKGVMLDAGTGLGYTAMAAAKSATHVVTIEADPHVLQMQKLNPWSQGLDRENITRVHGDVVAYVRQARDASFDNVILDAGTPRSSGDFFSLENYRQMRRILKVGGKLYHYIPEHGVKKGRDFPAEVIARIKRAGFRVQRCESYVIAA